MAEFDNLKQAVARERSVNASALVLIQGMALKLSALATAAANNTGTVSGTDIQALADQLNADSDGLSAAVAQNTPAQAPADQSGAAAGGFSGSGQTSGASGAGSSGAGVYPAASGAGSAVQGSAAADPDKPTGSDGNMGAKRPEQRGTPLPNTGASKR